MDPVKMKSSWDAWKMFDASKQEIENAKKRKTLMEQNKEVFRKVSQNPFDQGRGGNILDQAAQRWYSARATCGEHFKATRKTAPVLLWGYIIPAGLLCVLCARSRNYWEKAYRNGEVKMIDRTDKFLY